MNRNLLKPLAGVFALAVGMLSTPVTAQVGSGIMTGNIEAKLTLTSTCTINTEVFTVTSGASSLTYTSLNFGTTTTTFTEVDGATSLTYICSQGASPTIKLSDGNNFTASNRHMKHSGTTDVVRYELFTNAARTAKVDASGIIPINGSDTLHIYGRAYGGTGLRVGNYSDIITVTLTL